MKEQSYKPITFLRIFILLCYIALIFTTEITLSFGLMTLLGITGWLLFFFHELMNRDTTQKRVIHKYAEKIKDLRAEIQWRKTNEECWEMKCDTLYKENKELKKESVNV